MSSVLLCSILGLYAAYGPSPTLSMGSTCDQSVIYDTMIVYGFDSDVDNVLLLNIPMNGTDPRNTEALRERTYRYYFDEYDLDFADATNPDAQAAVNVPALTVYPLKFPDFVPYYIFGWHDTRDVLSTLNPGKVEHRLPVTNGLIKDVVYIVRPTDQSGTASVTWTTTKYGDVTLSGIEALVFGTYRVVILEADGTEVEVTDEENDIYYHNVPGTVIDGTGTVDCILNSTAFGVGRAFGNGLVEVTGVDPITGDIMGTIRSKNVMTFPESFADNVNTGNKKCKDLK